MKNIVLLKSSKIEGCNNNEIVDYEKPIEMQKVKFADGVFLCDPLHGTLGGLIAKEIEPGIYQSTRLSTHLMYEKAALS